MCGWRRSGVQGVSDNAEDVLDAEFLECVDDDVGDGACHGTALRLPVQRVEWVQRPGSAAFPSAAQLSSGEAISSPGAGQTYGSAYERTVGGSTSRSGMWGARAG